MARRGRRPLEFLGDMNDPRGMGVLLARFLQWMRVKNLSEQTALGRHGNLNRFIRWAEERGIVRPSDVNKPIVDRYQRYLFHFRKSNGARCPSAPSTPTWWRSRPGSAGWRATTISSSTRPANWTCPSWATACPSTS